MPESIYQINKRAVFRTGEQKEFLNSVKEDLGISWMELADKVGIHRRTLNGWRLEDYSLPLSVLGKIRQLSNVRMPKSITIKDQYWYIKNAGSLGAKACFKKYGSYGGDPEYRKKKWHEWWKREGKYKSNIIGVVKPIQKPSFSKELAEFVGILLGDGSIGKNQISVTLHSEDDKEYGDFVDNLIKKLFDVHVGLHHKKNCKAVSYNVSRIELIHFCTEKLGLKQGNKVKQQVGIPEWIKKNNSYSIACVRGLVDTDGCVFNHRYRVKGKQYNYKKLSFTNYSRPLLESVFKILKDNRLNPRIARKVDVRLDSIEDMKRYFDIFGSNNPKHLNKYYK